MLRSIGEMYAAVCPAVYHYWRPHLEAPFIVWAEDGETGFNAGDKKAEQGLTGTTDYFTKNEFDGMVESIQAAQDALPGFVWSLSSVQYEEDTNLIHVEWTWAYIG